MSIYAIYAISLVIILTMYLLLNTFNKAFVYLYKAISSNDKSDKNHQENLEINKQDYLTNLQLDKRLRHLEFINQLENYLKSTNGSFLSVEFLQEFEVSKREAQLSIIESADVI
ncbi:hypothetical protein [uncultured Winogradskyella sp.]|uniref:hypothetical protein n=1 Tax=uncultured Winogradskyella sp. TaxID=395353 RepID=UPI00260A99BE|nr:hypothetical protein [uncultured Winogradskyella sp.]